MSSSGALRLHPVDVAIAVVRDRADAAVTQLLEARGRDVGMSVACVHAVGSTTERHVFRGAVADDDRLRRRFDASGP